MAIEYLGLSNINGPLIVLEGVENAFYEEIVEFVVEGNQKKIGRIVEIYEDKAVIQVFEGTENMSLTNTHTKLTGHPMEVALSPDMLGRTFNGIGEPIDDLGPITSTLRRNINGLPLNPVKREYPRNYIRTGISAIDGLTTLIRGQKLPIFSGNGLPHDQLAAQIVKQASLGDDSDEQFAIVFAAMGVKHDVAEFFRRTFEESGVADHVAMFLNLANDPVVERLITPKVALTVAEYLAFEKNMHILVILTDMTSFAEAMREVSSSKGEIPSRKGFPGYLYSELATIYERAGIVEGVNGSVTQLPILTMLKALFTNQYFWAVMLLWTVQSVSFTITGTILPYYCKYIFNNDTWMYSALFLTETLVLVAGIFICSPLIKKFGKRNIAFVGGFVALGGQVLFFLNPYSFGFMVMSCVTRAIGLAPLNAVVFSMVGDVVEFGQWKNHIRQESLIFAGGSIGTKVGAGLASAVITGLLSSSGYVSSSAGITAQPETALEMIVSLYKFGPILIAAVIIVTLFGYKLDKMYPAIMQELTEREAHGQL